MGLHLFPKCTGSSTKRWILFKWTGFKTTWSIWITLQHKLPPQNWWKSRVGTSGCCVLSVPNRYPLVDSLVGKSWYLHLGFTTLIMVGPSSICTSGTSVPYVCLLEETPQYWNGIQPFLSWDRPEPVWEAWLVSYSLWWQFYWRPTTQHARAPRFGIFTEYIFWQWPCW